MMDILLALCLAAAFALGNLAMKRLDRFLERNRQAIDGRELDAPEGASTNAEAEHLPRVRTAGGRFLPPAGLRGSNLFPLRHRS